MRANGNFVERETGPYPTVAFFFHTGPDGGHFFRQIFQRSIPRIIQWTFPLILISLHMRPFDKKIPKPQVWGAWTDLQFYDILSLLSSVALDHVKFHLLTFIERFETITDDRAEMHEYVFAAFNLDKTKAFFCVKPFHCSCLRKYSVNPHRAG